MSITTIVWNGVILMGNSGLYSVQVYLYVKCNKWQQSEKESLISNAKKGEYWSFQVRKKWLHIWGECWWSYALYYHQEYQYYGWNMESCACNIKRWWIYWRAHSSNSWWKKAGSDQNQELCYTANMTTGVNSVTWQLDAHELVTNSTLSGVISSTAKPVVAVV